MPGKKSRSLDLLHFIKKFVYNLKMRVFLVGTLGLCLLPACGFAQGGKFISGLRNPGKVIKPFSPRPGFTPSLTPQVQRLIKQAAPVVKPAEKPQEPAYTVTKVPGLGTIYSFSAIPDYFVLPGTEELIAVSAEATNPAGSRESAFEEVYISGLGTLRSFNDKPDLYGLQVPTRRGHMDHFVPMDMKGVVTRLVNYTRQQNFANAWAQLGGLMQYDDVEPLAEHLHQLYRGQGISVLDPEGEEAVFYMIPLEGMKYRFDGTLLPLNITEYVVLFYPQRKVSQLLEQSKETLGKFRLIGNDPKIPQE